MTPESREAWEREDAARIAEEMIENQRLYDQWREEQGFDVERPYSYEAPEMTPQ